MLKFVQVISRAGIQCSPIERWEKKRVNSLGRDYQQLSSDDDNSQLKYLEWPSFQSTLKTATPTLVFVALLIVAPSSSLSVMDDTRYDSNVFINTHSVYSKF
ncbi:hypothetical protein Q3G72_032364 [Acer saccharum]|nr:hypothetical protein Q3G72_032364 [Acer saccharum]